MKRHYLFLLFSAITLTAFANTPANFGVNFRLNMPRATFETSDWNTTSLGEGLASVQDNSAIGYAGGVFLRLNGDRGFLHTEAMFAFNSTGFSALEGSSKDVLNYSTKSTSLNVPILVGRNLINSNLLKVRAFTGPSLSWMMKATATGTRNGSDIDDFDSDFDFENFTWLWSVGAGVEVLMFSLDVRYSFDIKGIEGDNGLEQSFNQKTNMLELTLGFRFF